MFPTFDVFRTAYHRTWLQCQEANDDALYGLMTSPLITRSGSSHSRLLKATGRHNGCGSTRLVVKGLCAFPDDPQWVSAVLRTLPQWQRRSRNDTAKEGWKTLKKALGDALMEINLPDQCTAVPRQQGLP
jgi:hypothetical protein